MAFEINDLKRILILVLFAIPVIASMNIDCNGKAFHCVNSTHFMICVDLGGGVSTTIDDFIIPCPATTMCHEHNIFECEFPMIEVLVPPLEVIGVSRQSDTSVTTSVNNSVTVSIEPSTETSSVLSDKEKVTVASLLIPEEETSASTLAVRARLNQNTEIINENNTEATMMLQESSGSNNSAIGIVIGAETNYYTKEIKTFVSDKNNNSLDNIVNAHFGDKFKFTDITTLEPIEISSTNPQNEASTSSSFDAIFSINSSYNSTATTVHQYITKNMSKSENVTDEFSKPKDTFSETSVTTDEISTIYSMANTFAQNVVRNDTKILRNDSHQNDSINQSLAEQHSSGKINTTDLVSDTTKMYLASKNNFTTAPIKKVQNQTHTAKAFDPLVIEKNIVSNATEKSRFLVEEVTTDHPLKIIVTTDQPMESINTKLIMTTKMTAADKTILIASLRPANNAPNTKMLIDISTEPTSLLKSAIKNTAHDILITDTLENKPNTAYKTEEINLKPSTNIVPFSVIKTDSVNPDTFSNIDSTPTSYYPLNSDNNRTVEDSTLQLGIFTNASIDVTQEVTTQNTSSKYISLDPDTTKNVITADDGSKNQADLNQEERVTDSVTFPDVPNIDKWTKTFEDDAGKTTFNWNSIENTVTTPYPHDDNEKTIPTASSTLQINDTPRAVTTNSEVSQTVLNQSASHHYISEYNTNISDIVQTAISMDSWRKTNNTNNINSTFMTSINDFENNGSSLGIMLYTDIKATEQINTIKPTQDQFTVTDKIINDTDGIGELYTTKQLNTTTDTETLSDIFLSTLTSTEYITINEESIDFNISNRRDSAKTETAISTVAPNEKANRNVIIKSDDSKLIKNTSAVVFNTVEEIIKIDTLKNSLLGILKQFSHINLQLNSTENNIINPLSLDEYIETTTPYQDLGLMTSTEFYDINAITDPQIKDYLSDINVINKEPTTKNATLKERQPESVKKVTDIPLPTSVEYGYKNPHFDQVTTEKINDIIFSKRVSTEYYKLSNLEPDPVTGSDKSNIFIDNGSGSAVLADVLKTSSMSKIYTEVGKEISTQTSFPSTVDYDYTNPLKIKTDLMTSGKINDIISSKDGISVGYSTLSNIEYETLTGSGKANNFIGNVPGNAALYDSLKTGPMYEVNTENVKEFNTQTFSPSTVEYSYTNSLKTTTYFVTAEKIKDIISSKEGVSTESGKLSHVEPDALTGNNEANSFTGYVSGSAVLSNGLGITPMYDIYTEKGTEEISAQIPLSSTVDYGNTNLPKPNIDLLTTKKINELIMSKDGHLTEYSKLSHVKPDYIIYTDNIKEETSIKSPLSSYVEDGYTNLAKIKNDPVTTEKINYLILPKEGISSEYSKLSNVKSDSLTGSGKANDSIGDEPGSYALSGLTTSSMNEEGATIDMSTYIKSSTQITSTQSMHEEMKSKVRESPLFTTDANEKQTVYRDNTKSPSSVVEITQLATDVNVLSKTTTEHSLYQTSTLNYTGPQLYSDINNATVINSVTEPDSMVETINVTGDKIGGTYHSGDLIISEVLYNNKTISTTNNIDESKKNITDQENIMKKNILQNSTQTGTSVLINIVAINNKEIVKPETENNWTQTADNMDSDKNNMIKRNESSTKEESILTSPILESNINFQNKVLLPLVAQTEGKEDLVEYQPTVASGFYVISTELVTPKIFAQSKKVMPENENVNIDSSLNTIINISDTKQVQNQSDNVSQSNVSSHNSLSEHYDTFNDNLEHRLKSTNHTITSEIQTHLNLNESYNQSKGNSNEIKFKANKPNIYNLNPSLTNIKLNASDKENMTFNRTASSFDCSNYARGKYSDKKDCRIFYFCVGNLQPVVGTCPNNTVFSEINKQCTRNLSHCVRNNQFRCLFEGRFSDFFKDDIYYICIRNGMNAFVRYKLQCQKNYHLNKDYVKCEKNVESSSQSASVDENSKVNEKNESKIKLFESQNTTSTDDFECESEGKFPHANERRKYYICTKTRKNVYRRKIKTCPSDEVYDTKKKKCVESDSTEC